MQNLPNERWLLSIAVRMIAIAVIGTASLKAQLPYYCDGIAYYTLYNVVQMTRVDGNTLYSYNSTYVTGPSPNYWVSSETSKYTLNGGSPPIYELTDNSAAGSSVQRAFTTTLYVAPNYHLGTYGLASTYWAHSPYCEYLGYTYTYEYHAASQSYTALKPTISVTGAPGYSSWAFWYLGGAPSIDGYYTQVALTGNTQWGTGTSPIAWSAVTGGSKINSSSNSGANVTVTSLAPSAGTSSDITVQISTDGLPSVPFSLYVNTPRSAVTSLYAERAFTGPPDAPGFETIFSYSPVDSFGYPLIPITAHETWENQKYDYPYLPGDPTWPSPSVTTASPGDWTANQYFDRLSGYGSLTPTPTSPSGGSTQVMNLTQKWWIGSASTGSNTFSGACIRLNKAEYFTDHATLPVTNTPTVTGDASVFCASGTYGN